MWSDFKVLCRSGEINIHIEAISRHAKLEELIFGQRNDSY